MCVLSGHRFSAEQAVNDVKTRVRTHGLTSDWGVKNQCLPLGDSLLHQVIGKAVEEVFAVPPPPPPARNVQRTEGSRFQPGSAASTRRTTRLQNFGWKFDAADTTRTIPGHSHHRAGQIRWKANHSPHPTTPHPTSGPELRPHPGTGTPQR